MHGLLLASAGPGITSSASLRRLQHPTRSSMKPWQFDESLARIETLDPFDPKEMLSLVPELELCVLERPSLTAPSGPLTSRSKASRAPRASSSTFKRGVSCPVAICRPEASVKWRLCGLQDFLCNEKLLACLPHFCHFRGLAKVWSDPSIDWIYSSTRLGMRSRHQAPDRGFLNAFTQQIPNP